MAAAKVTTDKQGDQAIIRVSGYVGENADLFVISLQDLRSVVIEMSGINYINSVGVKNWIAWTSRFPKGLRIQFENCPALIVNQINLVVGFIPRGAVVESLFATYVCEDCSVERPQKLIRGQNFQYATESQPEMVSLPEVNCPDCGNLMEFDAIQSKFFAFLRTPLPKSE